MQHFMFTDQASLWRFIRRGYQRDERENKDPTLASPAWALAAHCCLCDTRSSNNLSVSFSFFSYSLLKIAAISFKQAVKLFFFQIASLQLCSFLSFFSLGDYYCLMLTTHRFYFYHAKQENQSNSRACPQHWVFTPENEKGLLLSQQKSSKIDLGNCEIVLLMWMIKNLHFNRQKLRIN